MNCIPRDALTFGDPVAEAFQLGELRLCAVGEISVRGRGVPPAILDEGDL
jgi:hypothetical protein